MESCEVRDEVLHTFADIGEQSLVGHVCQVLDGGGRGGRHSWDAGPRPDDSHLERRREGRSEPTLQRMPPPSRRRSIESDAPSRLYTGGAR